MVEPDHLHGADFKAIAQNRIHDLSDQLGLDCMRFYYAEGAVFAVRTRFHHCLTRKDKVYLSFSRSGSVTAVTGVLCAVLPVKRTQGFWRFLSRFLRVGRPDEFSPLGDGVLGNKFHAHRIVRCHEVDESGVEALPLVLPVELPR